MTGFVTMGEVVECAECGHKILVERALGGVSHTLATFATCWECLSEEAKGKAEKLYGVVR